MLLEAICTHHNLDPHTPLYCVKEASQLLGVQVPTVWRWAKSGIIQTIKLPGTSYQRIPRSELERILTPSATTDETDELQAAG